MPFIESATLLTAIKTGLSMTGIAGITFGAIISSTYRSVPANQYMAKTGPFIKGVHVSRKTFQLPFQKIKNISMEPINYHFLGSNMSKELVPFKLPLTFTVSPKHPEKDLDGFIRYATRLGDMDHDGVKNIIGGIVNGETRGFVGGMTIQEIFNDKDVFRKHVVERVQQDLDQFGLEIHNANIEEMHDTEGNCYFENLKKKALEFANTSARIEVSEARKEGDIGEKQREVVTRKQRSALEADAKETETIQNQKMSDYSRELTITYTNNLQQEELAKIEAHKSTEMKRIEVESELNKRKQEQELERLRSEQIVKATADAESMLKKADADANAIKIKADAQRSEQVIKASADAESMLKNVDADAKAIKIRADAQKTEQIIKVSADAEALLKMADAEVIATKIRADALLYSKSKEAEGIKAVLEASAQGLGKIYEVSQTNPELANFYLALEKGIFNKDGLFSVIADKQAMAIKGLEPKINIWSTGQNSNKNNYTDVITELAKSVPPIIDAIQQQTQIKLPKFFSDETKRNSQMSNTDDKKSL